MTSDGRGRIVGGRIGDLTREAVGQPTPVILPEPNVLFARRADRLEALASGHPMHDWLRFMARLAQAQHRVVLALPTAEPVAVVEGEPPLGFDCHRRDPCWQEGLGVVLRHAGHAALPEPARVAIGALRDADAAAVESLAAAYLQGETHQADSAVAVFVAAALAAYFTHRAAALPVADVHLLPQRGRCPVCGFAPVAGLVTAAGPTAGVRYLHCGLCATAWNHVRAICVNCGGSRGLALHGIEDSDGAVQAETCDECHRYTKLLYQAKDMAVEPMADDLASLGLDVLVAEAGYRRHVANPLVI